MKAIFPGISQLVFQKQTWLTKRELGERGGEKERGREGEVERARDLIYQLFFYCIVLRRLFSKTKFISFQMSVNIVVR